MRAIVPRRAHSASRRSSVTGGRARAYGAKRPRYGRFPPRPPVEAVARLRDRCAKSRANRCDPRVRCNTVRARIGRDARPARRARRRLRAAPPAARPAGMPPTSCAARAAERCRGSRRRPAASAARCRCRTSRRCPARDAPFDAAWSAVAYAGTARDAMRALKFSAARPLAEVMAAQIAANAPASLRHRGPGGLAYHCEPARRGPGGARRAGEPARRSHGGAGCCWEPARRGSPCAGRRATRGPHGTPPLGERVRGAAGRRHRDRRRARSPRAPAGARLRSRRASRARARAKDRPPAGRGSPAQREAVTPARRRSRDPPRRRAAELRSPRARAAPRDPRRRRPHDRRHAARLRASAQGGRSAARRRPDLGAHAVAASGQALLAERAIENDHSRA